MMPLKSPNDNPNLDKGNNRTSTTTGLSSGYTVIGVTTIDTTLGWDTVTDSETQSTSDMSTSDEPLTVTKTVLSPPGNQPEEKTEIISNIIMSTITHEFTSTVTVNPSVELEPPSTVWITSLNPPTFVPPPPPTTSAAAPSSKSILSTVELVGVIIGTVCLLLMICIPVIYAIWRRRRTSTPSDSRNNITIRIGNGEYSRWSHSDDSRPTPIPASKHSQENVVRTEVIKRPISAVSPPPRYNDYWKGENEEYEMGVRETAGEASGSKFAEQPYSYPKCKGKARDDNWI